MASQLQCSICGKTYPVENPPSTGRFVCLGCSDRTVVEPNVKSVPNDRTVVEPPSAKTGPGGVANSLPDSQVLARFGNYEIVEEVSRGGVGIIYKAHQKGLNRIVALKVLQGGTSARSDHVQRFLLEAQAAAKLQHPNIVPIHDFGEHEGQYFFTMDFIEGQSLADLMARGPLQPRDALEIVKQVTEALQYAHEQGIVHRDIKPGNILLDKDHRVKVTDFGLAKEISRDELHLTMAGQVMGTPRYMSPEQATGRTSEADARSDIFSLGVSLYEMLTGRPAFEADSVIEMLQKVIALDPPRPHKVNRKVHRDIETICLKAMEKEPQRRYQSALEMTDDIDRFLAGEPIEAKPASVFYYFGRTLRKHWKAILLYAILLYLTIHGVILYLASRPSSLHLKVETPGAMVAVDHSALSDAELQSGLTLKAGQHEIQVESEPLYEPQQFTIETKPGENRAMDIALQRRKGALAIVVDPPDAGVTVDGGEGFHATFQGPTIEQQLPTGAYTLFVHKDNFLARAYEITVASKQTNDLRSSLLPITLWAGQTSGNVMSVPAVADLDGDGIGDVVAGDDDGRIYCLSGRNGVPLWVFRTKDAVQAPVALADVNRDGTPDIIVGSTDHDVYCLDGKNGQALWTFETHGAIYGPALLKDANGDGVPDAFVGSDDGHLYAINGADAKTRRLSAYRATDGGVLWQARLPGESNTAIGAPTIGDGVVVVGDGTTGLYCFSLDSGTQRWAVAMSEVVAPAAIDKDGAYISDGKGALHGLSLRDGKELWQFPVSDPFPSAPALVDINGDGHNDVVAVSDNGVVYALDGKTGNQLWDYQFSMKRTRSRNGIVLANPDGNAFPDGVVVNPKGDIICLDLKTGKPKWTYPLGEPVMSTPVIADMNGDGVPDIIVGTMGRRVHCISGKGDRQLWSYEVGAQIRYCVPAVVRSAGTKGAPRVVVGTGPPENALYCLSGDSPQLQSRGWSGPWKELTTAK